MIRAYERRVSFNTFDNRDATDYSFNLIAKHKHYTYSQRSRTFLCGTDENDYSEFALQWLLDELVEDGDEVVCLRVVDKDSKIASGSSIREGRYKEEAEKLLEDVQNKNKEDEKAINLVLEFAVGKVPETIQRMVCARTDHGLVGCTPLLIATLDSDLFSSLPHCWHTGATSRRCPSAPSRICLQILPTKLTGPGCRRPPIGQTSQEEAKEACRCEEEGLSGGSGSEWCKRQSVSEQD